MFESPQAVRPSAIHSDAFHTAHANDLDADIVTAVLLVGKGDQSFGGGVQVGFVGQTIAASSDDSDRPVQTIGAKDENIVGQDLVLVGFSR